MMRNLCHLCNSEHANPNTSAAACLGAAAAESELEAAFDMHWQRLGGRPLTPEYRFAAALVGGPGRGLRARLDAAGLHDWRFDRADLGSQVAVELEGGTWTQGRHVRPEGFAGDCAKYNAAALAGWLVIRLTGDMLRDDPAGHLEPVIGAMEVRRAQMAMVLGLADANHG
ncbi:MAG: hypothetical protein KDE23_19075 [Caldilinea sp.]|nr:hypothetical protein [Caldilinea sp.]